LIRPRCSSLSDIRYSPRNELKARLGTYIFSARLAGFIRQGNACAFGCRPKVTAIAPYFE
jgi:hypothetical protein